MASRARRSIVACENQQLRRFAPLGRSAATSSGLRRGRSALRLAEVLATPDVLTGRGGDARAAVGDAVARAHRRAVGVARRGVGPLHADALLVVEAAAVAEELAVLA